jgi:hypothetical protein
MNPDPQNITAAPGRTGRLSVARVKQLLILSTLAIVLTGCGLPSGRDVRAYNACVARHPQEAALCDGPRQAYEVDAATLQVGAGSINPQTVGTH